MFFFSAILIWLLKGKEYELEQGDWRVEIVIKFEAIFACCKMNQYQQTRHDENSHTKMSKYKYN